MSLNNEQLLLLDALAYYAELSDNKYKKIGDFIKAIKDNRDDFQTVFNGALGYTDKELGMDKIIELIDNDNTLKELVIVYPDTYDDKTTSSVCLIDPATYDVYVIYVGNYIEEHYEYTEDKETIDLNSWVENAMGAVEADTSEQKRELEFYDKAIAAARKYLKKELTEMEG